MRSAISMVLLTPLLAQCAPLLRRAGPVQTSASSSISDSASSSASTAPSSTSELAFNSTTVSSTATSSMTAESASLQPEIVASPDGSESVFVAPGSSSYDDSNRTISSQGDRPLVMGYYPCWSSMLPSQINYTSYDWIDFAFATVDENQLLSFSDSSCSTRLQQIVENAHTVGKSVKLSVGGWGGSQYFSSAVATPNSRQMFVARIGDFIYQHPVDGIDFDWEYPGRQGSGGNQMNPADSDNFFSFLQLLRSTFPDLTITAAVSQDPFTGSDGQPMKDVSHFASVLDWVTIMNYDVWESSPNPGPNAPLSNYCQNSSQPQASAANGIEQWSAAGFPKTQQVMGVPYYGQLSNSTATGLRARASSPSIRANSDDGSGTGSVSFVSLLNQGILAPSSSSSSGEASFVGAGGFSRYWDSCSSTPFLISQATNQVVAYDDPQSLGMKAKLVKETGLKGVNVWSLDGDNQGVLASTLWNNLVGSPSSS